MKKHKQSEDVVTGCLTNSPSNSKNIPTTVYRFNCLNILFVDERSDYSTAVICVPLWTTCHVGLVVNVVPGDDVVEACGGRLSDSEDQSPVEGFPQQLQNFLPLLGGGEVGSARGAAVPHPRVWMLRLGW